MMTGCFCGSSSKRNRRRSSVKRRSAQEQFSRNTSSNLPLTVGGIDPSHANRRVLILGTGGSGKTTLFRQLQSDWSEKSLNRYRPVVHACLVQAIKSLLEQAELLVQSHPSQRTALQKSSSSARHFVKHELAYDDMLDRRSGRHIAQLWADAGIRRTYEMRARFGLPIAHSAAYFLERINEISSPQYLPSISDVLNLEVRSTGIVDAAIDIDGRLYEFIDIGGQRSQRLKWMRCFHNVRAVVFVVALSDFDEVLLEDSKTSRFHESLAVFTELVNSSLCRDLPFIIVFNKIDMLAQKMRRLRLSDFFPHFKGGADVEKAVAFFRQIFISKVQKGGARVTEHIAVATDRSRSSAAISGIFETVSSATDSAPNRYSSAASQYSMRQRKQRPQRTTS